MAVFVMTGAMAVIGCNRDRSTSASVPSSSAAQTTSASQPASSTAQPAPTARPASARETANPDAYRATSAGSPSAFPTTRPGQFTNPSDTAGANLPPSGGDATPPGDRARP
jgi:hypothetical protein